MNNEMEDATGYGEKTVQKEETPVPICELKLRAGHQKIGQRLGLVVGRRFFKVQECRLMLQAAPDLSLKADVLCAASEWTAGRTCVGPTTRQHHKS
jgi:hypothetical protein